MVRAVTLQEQLTATQTELREVSLGRLTGSADRRMSASGNFSQVCFGVCVPVKWVLICDQT